MFAYSSSAFLLHFLVVVMLIVIIPPQNECRVSTFITRSLFKENGRDFCNKTVRLQDGVKKLKVSTFYLTIHKIYTVLMQIVP